MRIVIEHNHPQKDQQEQNSEMPIAVTDTQSPCVAVCCPGKSESGMPPGHARIVEKEVQEVHSLASMFHTADFIQMNRGKLLINGKYNRQRHRRLAAARMITNTAKMLPDTFCTMVH